MGALSLYASVDLRFVSYFAAIGGLLMFQAARAVSTFSLSRDPLGTTALYVFAGLAGLSFLPFTHIPESHRAFRWAKIGAALLIIAMSLIALYTGFNAMYDHIESAVAG